MSDRAAGMPATELPEGWAWATLDEVADINPKAELNNFARDLEVSFVRMAAVEEETGRLNPNDIRMLGDVAKGYTRFREGDILFAKITPCMENGKIALAKDLRNGLGFGSTEFHVLRPRRGVEAKYLLHFLLQPSFRGYAEHNMKGTAGQKRVPPDILRHSWVPIAPTFEQRRIVEKIETLLSEIANGVDSLGAAYRKFDIYQLSLLQSAFTGKMTEGWRSVYGQDDAQMETSILISSKNKNPVDPNLERVATTIPEGWGWVSPDQISRPSRNSITIGPFGSSLKVSDYKSEGVPLIFVRHIRTQHFSSHDPKFISESKSVDLKSHKVFPGDILVTKMGDPPGDACIYPSDCPEGVLTADCIKISTEFDYLDKMFFVHAIRSPVVSAQIKKITTGVAQQKVSLERFKSIALPFPPKTERREIGRRLTEAYNRLTGLERSTLDGIQRADFLRRSILRTAFAGALVTQDPDDEPAGQLLARIGAEKAAAETTARRHPRAGKMAGRNERATS